MSSTDKTSVLKLNQWASSDKPCRADFNYDNEMIERAVTWHAKDAVAHITAKEREIWNLGVHYGMYFGDGEAIRYVDTYCPFEPKFVLVFASTRPASVVDFEQGKKYNYIAFASQISSMANLELINYGAQLKVTQDISPTYRDEYIYLNQNGVSYTYIMFR